MRIRGHFFSAVLLATLPFLHGCVSNPATGEKMHQEMLAQDAVYDDPELQAYVNRIGQRLVSNSDKPDMPFTFTVIDSPDINAFALPGGYIYINRGLLAYLDNEAELAGVLGHEIGHVTANHHGRQQGAAVTNAIVANTAYILTGSGDLADASNMYGTELISGFGREMELEADGLGAEYMHESGYDPESLLEVIGALKNQQNFQRVKAKNGGTSRVTYHGLYATHPRNDQRLRKVISTAAELETDTFVEDPSVPGEFRRHIEGLVWGDSVQSTRSPDRYYHNKLAFSFIQPPGWRVNAGSQAIVASAADGSATLRITVQRRNPSSSPSDVLKNTATGSITEGMSLDQAGLKGFTALSNNSSGTRRLAVIDYRNLSYLFDGDARNLSMQDTTLLGMIESFRPMHPREQRANNGSYLHYIQVPRGATMASLAAGMRVPDAEAQLRLLNDFYPRGEPRTGDWIKVIR